MFTGPVNVFGCVPPRVVPPGDPSSVSPPGPLSAPLRVRNPLCVSVRPALRTPVPLRVKNPPPPTTLGAVTVNGLAMVVIAPPAPADSPNPLPTMRKSPADEASLITIVRPVSPVMSLFGPRAEGEANPGAVVSKISVSPELGAAPSAQFPLALQELLVAPVQCSVAGVVRSSSGSTRSRKGVRGAVRLAADRRGRRPRNQWGTMSQLPSVSGEAP